MYLTLNFDNTENRQGRAASNPEEVTMIRFDFDVVSDPLPPRRIVPPAAAEPPPAPPAEEVPAEVDASEAGKES